MTFGWVREDASDAYYEYLQGLQSWVKPEKVACPECGQWLHSQSELDEHRTGHEPHDSAMLTIDERRIHPGTEVERFRPIEAFSVATANTESAVLHYANDTVEVSAADLPARLEALQNNKVKIDLRASPGATTGDSIWIAVMVPSAQEIAATDSLFERVVNKSESVDSLIAARSGESMGAKRYREALVDYLESLRALKNMVPGVNVEMTYDALRRALFVCDQIGARDQHAFQSRVARAAALAASLAINDYSSNRPFSGIPELDALAVVLRQLAMGHVPVAPVQLQFGKFIEQKTSLPMTYGVRELAQTLLPLLDKASGPVEIRHALETLERSDDLGRYDLLKARALRVWLLNVMRREDEARACALELPSSEPFGLLRARFCE